MGTPIDAAWEPSSPGQGRRELQAWSPGSRGACGVTVATGHSGGILHCTTRHPALYQPALPYSTVLPGGGRLRGAGK